MKPFSGDVYLSEIWVTLDEDCREAKVKELEQWLANRPSASMDPAFDTRVRKINELRQLKSSRRTLDRPISKIMAAQQMDEYDMSDLPW